MFLTVEIDLESGYGVHVLGVLHGHDRVESHAWLVHCHKSGKVREKICVALVVKAMHFCHIEALAGKLCHCLADD